MFTLSWISTLIYKIVNFCIFSVQQFSTRGNFAAPLHLHMWQCLETLFVTGWGVAASEQRLGILLNILNPWKFFNSYLVQNVNSARIEKAWSRAEITGISIPIVSFYFWNEMERPLVPLHCWTPDQEYKICIN